MDESVVDREGLSKTFELVEDNGFRLDFGDPHELFAVVTEQLLIFLSAFRNLHCNCCRRARRCHV